MYYFNIVISSFLKSLVHLLIFYPFMSYFPCNYPHTTLEAYILLDNSRKYVSYTSWSQLNFQMGSHYISLVISNVYILISIIDFVFSYIVFPVTVSVVIFPGMFSFRRCSRTFTYISYDISIIFNISIYIHNYPYSKSISYIINCFTHP